MKRDNETSNQAYAFLMKGKLGELGKGIRDAVLFGYSGVGLFAFVSCEQREHYQKVDLSYLLAEGVNFSHSNPENSSISSDSAHPFVLSLLEHAQSIDLHVPCRELTDKLRTVTKFFA